MTQFSRSRSSSPKDKRFPGFCIRSQVTEEQDPIVTSEATFQKELKRKNFTPNKKESWLFQVNFKKYLLKACCVQNMHWELKPITSQWSFFFQHGDYKNDLLPSVVPSKYGECWQKMGLLDSHWRSLSYYKDCFPLVRKVH